MSDLTFVEKKKLEELFGMKNGNVLDLSHRTLAELVRDCTGLDIHDSRYEYGSGSKANRLRAFWEKEDNSLVGRLLSNILDYGEATGPLYERCRLIVARLLGSSAAQAGGNRSSESETLQQQRRSEALRRLREEFFRLAGERNRSQAGLAFEKLLNELFELFGLRTRHPFRVIGEQIDGSFELDGQVYLLESKWEKNALPEAPLLVFRGKIEGKSTFTRGVFIALNDISAQAHDAITRGKAPSFFVVNGHDIIMILSEAMGLSDFLRKRVRLLAEEGRMCVPFSELV